MGNRRRKPTKKDAVDSVVEGYRAATDKNGEMDFLLPHAEERRVFEELLAVIAAPGHDPGARCKALRRLQEMRAPVEEVDRQRVMGVLLGIVTSAAPREDLDGCLVREYAAHALHHYAERKEVEDVRVAILTDQSQGYNMRRAAFDGLSGAGWSARKSLFEALLKDPVLAEDAENLLLIRGSRRAEQNAAADRPRD